MTALSDTARERWQTGFRILVAAFGGYAFAAALATLMALVLPGARAETVLAGMLLSFAFYAMAVVWVFGIRNIWLATLAVPVATGLISALCAVLVRAGGGA